MTNYAGEGYRIATEKETDYDGLPLTPGKVQSVSVEVFNADFTEQILTNQTMTWDSVISHWVYVWDTATVPAGTYKAKVTIIGQDGLPSFEYVRVRLARDPHPDT